MCGRWPTKAAVCDARVRARVTGPRSRARSLASLRFSCTRVFGLFFFFQLIGASAQRTHITMSTDKDLAPDIDYSKWHVKKQLHPLLKRLGLAASGKASSERLRAPLTVLAQKADIVERLNKYREVSVVGARA